MLETRDMVGLIVLGDTITASALRSIHIIYVNNWNDVFSMKLDSSESGQEQTFFYIKGGTILLALTNPS